MADLVGAVCSFLLGCARAAAVTLVVVVLFALRWPESATPVVATTYTERLIRFVTELLPRALGLGTHGGDWVGPNVVAVGVAALLILVAGVPAFPILAT